MKYLKTNINGGFPLVLDDFRWIDTGMKEALAGFLGALTGGADCILSGCSVAGSNPSANVLIYTVTQGWAFINGQICFCPAVASETTLTGTGPVFYWGINTVFDNTGLKTFDDGFTHDTYQVDQASILIGNNALPAGRMYWDSQIKIADTVGSLILDDVLPFSRYIKFGFNTGGLSLEAGGLNVLDERNTVVMNFNGTFDMPNAAPGLPGALVIIKMKATTGTKFVTLKHNVTATGYMPFWVKQQRDVIVNDNDVVVLSCDGTYWNVLSQHVALLPTLSLTGGWSGYGTYGLKIFKSNDGEIKLQGSLEIASYTSGTNNLIGTLPADCWPPNQIFFPVVDTFRQNIVGTIDIEPDGKVYYIEQGAAAVSVQIPVSSVKYYPI